jgi:hypothetical protein
MLSIAFLLVVLSAVAETSRKSKTFETMMSLDGEVMCAVDEPTDFELMPLGDVVQCGFKCSANPRCKAFNYNEPIAECDIYCNTPQNFSSIPGCIGYFDLGFQFVFISELSHLVKFYYVANNFLQYSCHAGHESKSCSCMHSPFCSFNICRT